MKLKFPRFGFFRGLAFRYSIFFLLAIFLILFIPLVIGFGASSALLVIQAQKEASIMTDQTVTEFEKVLQPTEMVPQTLVQAMENPLVSYSEILRLAREFIRHDTNVMGTCLAFEPYAFKPDAYWYAPYAIERNGEIRTRLIGSQDYDYFKMDWYRLPKLLQKPVWTEPYFDAGAGDTMMCTYSTPFYRIVNGKKTFAGVLTMDVSLSGFAKLVKNISVFESGYGFLVSGKGTIITAPRPDLVNKNLLLLARAGKGKETQVAVRRMLEGKSGWNSMDGLQSQKMSSYLSYAPVGKTGMSFGIIFPEKELYDDLYSFLKFMSWMFGISIFILLVTTILITRKLTRPIVRLVEATRKIGQGDFNAKLPVRKSKDEIAQLTKAFSVMQEELRTYTRNLEETTIAKEKIESELNVAHSIQMGMLPTGFTMPDNWELFATLDPAKAVGGDLYDFFYLDEHHLCIAIGDVAGKGVPASLFMMVTRTLFRAKAKAGLSLDRLMSGINEELCRENPNQMFVTFFAGIVDLQTGIMEFCNAGHNYPYVISTDGGIRQLKIRNGIPLGIFEDSVYTSDSYSFTPGEILVVTTDGITDALNNTNDFFGEAQLASALGALAKKDTRSLTELLIAEVKRFSTGTEQADDITILTLQYKEHPSKNSTEMENVQLTLKNQVSELDAIVQKLEELAERWGIPLKTVMEVNLALEELFTNVVFYAYDDNDPHVIKVDFTRLGDGIRLRLEDDGKPFNLLEKEETHGIGSPLDDRQIGGLGIHFIRKMMENVEYHREGGHNIVILTKHYSQ